VEYPHVSTLVACAVGTWDGCNQAQTNSESERRRGVNVDKDEKVELNLRPDEQREQRVE
jgi:hypothetical protein